MIPVWKTADCKWGNLKHPVFNVLNFRGWMKLIFDTVDYIKCNFVISEFNSTSEVQNIGNGVFQNAPFASVPFANGRFLNGGYSCLWALFGIILVLDFPNPT